MHNLLLKGDAYEYVNFKPLILAAENSATIFFNKTSSLIIAETFDKQHTDVLRDIANLSCSADFRQLNFALSYYTMNSHAHKILDSSILQGPLLWGIVTFTKIVERARVLESPKLACPHIDITTVENSTVQISLLSNYAESSY